MKSIKITIDKNKILGSFECFGASGAWWAQDVGLWEHTDEASGKPAYERIAELLFNGESGIGIGCYRYNLGGGSKNSGSCTFSSGNRAAESFDVGENEYDWSRDFAAVRMLREAVKNGCSEVIFFVNSPPERWTKNHKSCLDKPWRSNLPKKNYPAFARYCLDVTEHFVNEGIPVRYISPVNEPLWVWTEKHGQEGCHYTPREVRGVMLELAEQLKLREKLSGVMLSGAENGDIRWFNKAYTRAVLNNPLVRKSVDAVDIHSYFLHAPLPSFFNNRLAFMRRYKKWMDKKYPDVPIKISEWTHMKGGRDYGIDSALEQAKIMSEDICVLGAVSWQLWIAVSDVDYCDGLIYINKDKSFELTKRYFAFGNFSKYIPRDSKRIAITGANASLLLNAFEKDGAVTVVAVNLSASPVMLDFENVNCSNATLVVTDCENNLTESTVSPHNIHIPARSISTCFYKA